MLQPGTFTDMILMSPEKTIDEGNILKLLEESEAS